MGVRILEATDGHKVLYCSTTMTAFGPVFYEKDEVEDFLEWLKVDPRELGQRHLDDKVHEWREYEEDKAFERYSEGLYEGDGNFADNH